MAAGKGSHQTRFLVILLLLLSLGLAFVFLTGDATAPIQGAETTVGSPSCAWCCLLYSPATDGGQAKSKSKTMQRK